MNKLNKTLIAILLVLCVGLVGITIAYFSNSTSIENEFNTNPYGTIVTEEFVSPDNWIPGTTTPKTLTVTNSGLVDEAVRISYEESWTSKNSTEVGDLALSQNNNRAAIINWTNTDDWTTVTEDGKIYKYYNYKLSPSSTTSELLESVTFNKDIVNSSNCVTTSSNGEETITCNSIGDGYDGATYKLTFRVETVQYDKYKIAWGTSINIESTKEIIVYGLNVNPKSSTYETGNKHQMFMFDHEATEQTPALTDYRYIGDDPYNYVFFNCDNLNNQNANTCEVWRIIGVFDVERPDPNDSTKTITERRMKLVRGNVLPIDMKWNTNFENDWTTSTLKVFLNSSYLNRTGDAVNNGLKISAREMIETARYYLGSLSLHPSKWIFGTTEKIYGEERGNVLCGACNGDNSKLVWQGDVGLMYPSDEYMVYAGGVNDACYTDPTTCHEINAETGWIFNSNIKQGDSSKDYIWLLSPRGDNNSARELFVSSDGYLFDYRSVNDGVYGVRPVVYLSSSVKIIDGDGSSSNPYWLSNY